MCEMFRFQDLFVFPEKVCPLSGVGECDPA